MDDFLRDSEIEMGWSILLLQEFTASSFSERFRSSAGHQVFFVSPTEGNRSCAMVIHVSIVHRVLGHTFVHRDRGVAVGLHWEGWNLLVLSSHIHPGHSGDLYSESLIQLQELMEVGNLRSKFVSSRLFAREILDTPVYRIIGIDAQASVVRYLSRDHQAIIGDAANGSVSWKGTEFVRLCLENNLKLWNTFSADVVDIWTCHHDFRFPVSQIDYILSDIPRRATHEAGVKAGSATVTDHRAPYMAVCGKWMQPQRKYIRQAQPPPIGWTHRDANFCNLIRRAHGWREVECNKLDEK